MQGALRVSRCIVGVIGSVFQMLGTSGAMHIYLQSLLKVPMLNHIHSG